MRLPDFYIVGAPKAGTTSIADYLREHPEAFLSDPKEPCYWADDLKVREVTGFVNEDAYARLFATAKTASVVGEASTLYLFSKNAIRNIIRSVDKPKFIVGLRHPVEIAQGLHMQARVVGREDVSNFESAWRLQEDRKAGRHLPRSNYDDVQLLQYRELSSIGTQLDRLLGQIPRERVFIYFFEDLRQSTENVYRAILDFLGLEHNGRTEFEKRNRFRDVRSPFFAGQLHSRFGRQLTSALKSRFPPRVVQPLRSLKNALVYRTAARPSLDAEFRDELLAEFEREIQILESITRRDLLPWRLERKLVG